MKGFGDLRGNIPAILNLVEQGVLSLMDAVATMTTNVAQFIAKKIEQKW
jgi:dihydroorotase-like cyclic amidohydrolase